jgi:hypothetical protein
MLEPREDTAMRRVLVIIASIFALVAFRTSSATASSAHFKKGGSPTCTIAISGSSASTTCDATLAGLGNGNVHITTTVSGFAVYQCQNGGGNTAPGQNKVLVGPVTAPTDIDSSAIKNGNLTFHTNAAVLTAPTTVSGAAAGCPNPNWTGVNPTLTVTDVSLDISQGGVLLFSCSASNPKGLSGTFALTC